MSRSMHYGGVKITASKGGGGWLLDVLLLVVVLTGGGVLVRWLVAAEAPVDEIVGVLFDVAGVLAGLATLGTLGWLTYDALVSRRAVRRFDSRHPGLRAELARRAQGAVEHEQRPAVESARLHVPAERVVEREESAP